MWQLEKGNLFLSKTSLNELRKIYKKEPNSKAKLRLLAAMKRKQGKSIDEISELLEKPRKTIHGWLTYFQQRGISGKDSIKQTGRPLKLSKKQIQELVKTLERGPPHNPRGLWTTKEVREFIRKKYGISFVSQHVWRILIAFGFTLQRPRKKHHKTASPEEIKRFKKTPDAEQDATGRKDLLWPQRMKQHLV